MNIQLRRRKWHAVHDIPKDVRAHFNGRLKFVQSLKTPDKAKAKIEAAALEAQWRMEIEQARGNDVTTSLWQARIKNAGSNPAMEIELDMIKDEAHQKVIDLATKLGVADTDDPTLTTHPEYQEIDQAFKVATGQVTPLMDTLEDWLSVLGNTQKTKDMKRSTINKFAITFPTVEQVRRKDVQAWINRLVTVDGIKAKTITRILSELRSYWKHLVALEVASDTFDPFDKLAKPQAPRKEGSGGDHWKPFTPVQLVAVLKAAQAKTRRDHDLEDLITLGMWSGARIESLCSLKVEDVKGDYFSIIDDKTEAGKRDVPIHPKLQPTIDRLIGNRSTGYVLANLTENKYGDRSNAIGKRFGKLKEGLGYTSDHTFHSIRKTVVTLLENLGVPENVTADIVGHEKPRITYGLYSGGNELEVKREALKKLCYPDM